MQSYGFIKKIRPLLLLFVALATSTQMYAQFKAEEQRFRGGLVGGFNASQIDGDEAAGFNKLGLNVGVKGGIVFHPNWELGLEILFSQKGSRSTSKDIVNNLQINLNYAEVPVLIQFMDWEATDAEGRRFNRIMLYGGVSIGRLVGGSVRVGGIRNENWNENYKDWDYEMLFGAGFFINRHFAVDARWASTLPFWSITTDGQPESINRLLTLRALYML